MLILESIEFLVLLVELVLHIKNNLLQRIALILIR